MVKILNEPIYEEFFNLIAGAKNSIKLCAPFVKSDIIEEIYNRRKVNTNISVITNINLMSFVRKSSDIEALSTILNNRHSLFNLQNLHAKIYIFDDSKAIITSANLTSPGMKRNYEYGVYIDEPDVVDNICSDFENLCRSELTGSINLKHIDEIKDLLNSIPPLPNLKAPKYTIDNDIADDIFTENTEYITSKLHGWKKDVFEVLQQIEHQMFSLSEVYDFKDYFQKRHPKNYNIEAKIRQQLQQLRDIGLIKFETPGVYRKLWE